MEKVKVGTGRHAKRALALGVGFSGALSSTAAQNLAAYTVFSGKVKKSHKMSQVLYNGFVPLTQAIYFPASHTVALLPRGKHKLPKLEQLHVNVSILTHPMGRPINNGKNFTATVTSTGLVVSADRMTVAGSPSAPAIDALLERGLVPAVRRAAGKPPYIRRSARIVRNAERGSRPVSGDRAIPQRHPCNHPR